MFKNNLLLIVISSFLFTGCATMGVQKNVDMSQYKDNSTYKFNQERAHLKKRYDIVENITHSNYTSKKSAINEKLFSFYKEWKGVRYRLGGQTKKGIDCSAFVQKVISEKFDIQLPRDTKSQALIGKPIKKSELKMGDLVFFKTGRTNHVGIYIENGKFMHASTKIGVTISELDNAYFKKHYWKAQRIFN